MAEVSSRNGYHRTVHRDLAIGKKAVALPRIESVG